ncbi:uncharacterized protein HMPREF1541_10625 [Cyphellophora europaea CBS 101466]|uniref:Uncharacterized protein n=1 Tax=Cyphellophora europaea (strain CBS 101466) TaxID=1220924 RepID=W2S972_CYPE1|nr:uncharacterized protein HMPREF1541_10625 [Cyphellophora europaea CBS 101466]ETN44444.1 hypothetical protein HMPREF1541_10625 [Cyphellophora europaea CBS 101466]
MDTPVEQLSKLVGHLDPLISGLNTPAITKDELPILNSLALRLGNAALTLQKTTGYFTPFREDPAQTRSSALMNEAQRTIANLVDSGTLENPSAFRRSILLIFQGPKSDNFNSKDVKSRKAITERRCAEIRKLSPDGIVAWAVAFNTSSWIGGTMGQNIFDYLIDDIEPNNALPWPSQISETLGKLQSHEDLQKSVEYGQFLNSI